MDALERIRSLIDGFGGYTDPQRRRLSDEQIRSFVGEALAGLPEPEVQNMPAEQRAEFDRVLLRCEFINQEAFRLFDAEPTPQRIEAILSADAEIVETAVALAKDASAPNGVLARLNEAFDKRDDAMQRA